MRNLASALVGAVASLLLPVALSAYYVYLDGPTVLPDGTYDDAPARVAGLFLFLVAPVSFVLLTIYYVAIPAFLRAVSRDSLRNLLICDAVLVAAIAILFANSSESRDEVIAGGFLVLLIGICLAIGAFVWKVFRSRPPHN